MVRRHAASAPIGVEQATTGKVLGRGGGDGVDSLEAGPVGEHGPRGVDDAVLDLLLVAGRILVRGDTQGAADPHGGVVPHELQSSVVAVGQGGAVDECHVPVRVLEDRLEDVRHVPTVFEVVDAAGGDGRLRDPQIEDHVDGVVLVREQVTCQAGAVVVPAAPAEEPLEIERHLVGCRSFELFPVDGLRAAVFVDVPDPGAPGGVAVGGAFHQRDGPENLGIDDFASLHVSLGLSILMAQLKDDVGAVDGVVDCQGLFFCAGHAFLAVDMHARGHGVEGHLRVPMVGRGDDDGVHLAAGQKVLIVTVALGCRHGSAGPGPCVDLRSGDPALGSHIEHITDRRQLDIQVLLAHVDLEGLVARVFLVVLASFLHPVGRRESGVPDQGLALAAIADDSQPDALTRGPGDGLRDVGRTALLHTQLRQDGFLLDLLGSSLLPETEEERSDHRERDQRFEKSAASDPGLRSRF